MAQSPENNKNMKWQQKVEARSDWWMAEESMKERR